MFHLLNDLSSWGFLRQGNPEIGTTKVKVELDIWYRMIGSNGILRKDRGSIPFFFLNRLWTFPIVLSSPCLVIPLTCLQLNPSQASFYFPAHKLRKNLQLSKKLTKYPIKQPKQHFHQLKQPKGCQEIHQILNLNFSILLVTIVLSQTKSVTIFIKYRWHELPLALKRNGSGWTLFPQWYYMGKESFLPQAQERAFHSLCEGRGENMYEWKYY